MAQFATTGLAVQRVARNRLLAWLVLAASLAISAVAIATTEAAPSILSFTLYGVIGGCAALASLYFGQPSAPGRRRMAPAEVRIDDGAVTVAFESGATRSWPRAAVREGWVDSHAGLHTAILRMKNGDQVWIGRDSVRDANELLAAAGVAPDQQVFSARLLSDAARFPGGGLFAGAGLLLGVPTALGFALAMLAGGTESLLLAALVAVAALTFGYKLIQALVPPRAVVGTDGVRIEGVGRKRFIAFADVARVECDAAGVWLRRRDGRDEQLRTGHATTGTGTPLNASANTVALFHRVREARALGAASSVPQAKQELLDRRGRPPAEWLRELSALTQKEAGYRDMAIDREELVQVLLDAGTPAERRIGAAVALCAGDEPQIRDRVRIAADSCANERLRVAIDAVADGELDEETLEQATSETPAARRTA